MREKGQNGQLYYLCLRAFHIAADARSHQHSPSFRQSVTILLLFSVNLRIRSVPLGCLVCITHLCSPIPTFLASSTLYMNCVVSLTGYLVNATIDGIS